MHTETQVELVLGLHKLESADSGDCVGEQFRKLEEQLEPSLLKYYRKIRQRRGSGVAVLQNRTCSERRMVYPEAHSVVRCNSLIHRCEYCGRLLVASENPAPAKSQPEIPPADSPALGKYDAESALTARRHEPVPEGLQPPPDNTGLQEGEESASESIKKPLVLRVDDDEG